MKTNYLKLLSDPRWQKKRLEIMKRDDFKCKLCLDESTTLNVHHKEYIYGNLPWEYDEDKLITLCKHCHQLAEIIKKHNIDITRNKIFKIPAPDGSIVFFISQHKGFLLAQLNSEMEVITILEIKNHFTEIFNFLSKIKNNE